MIPKSFSDYIEQSEREYSVRIKTLVPLDDQAVEYIERILNKYVLKDMTKPVKTIMQKHPMDFSDVNNAEVYIVDVVTALPISAYVLQQELKLALNIPEKYIVVRNANDPREVENQNQAARDEIDMTAMDKKLSPASRLSTCQEYDDDELGTLEEPVYGDEYNSKFLEYLAQIKADRERFAVIPHSDGLNVGGEVADPVVVDSPQNDFNEKIVDAPQPKYSNYAEKLKNLRKERKQNHPRLSTKGNYDDDEIQQTKKFDQYGTDKKVAKISIKNQKEGIRKKD